MKRRKKILVFGFFGFITNQLDGQTVKTRSVYELLLKRAEANVRYADSQEFKHDPQSVFRFIRDLFWCNTLVILPCLNNLKIIFPFIWILSYIFRYSIIHIGIGGWHKEYLTKWNFVRFALKRIKVNLLENTKTCEELIESFNFDNVEVFPNFRDVNVDTLKKGDNDKMRLVFLARINIKKGLDTLSSLALNLEQMGFGKNLEFDFFGPFDSDDDKNYLMSFIKKYDWIKYNGKLEPNEIQEHLVNYDIMLFPTHYFTEGFPGTILDAYMAGLPVIATEWKHSHQFIIHGKTGYIVDFNNPVIEIERSIEYLLNNREVLKLMQINAFNESKKYTASQAWNTIKSYL